MLEIACATTRVIIQLEVIHDHCAGIALYRLKP
jgi:hypothetical protein